MMEQKVNSDAFDKERWYFVHNSKYINMSVHQESNPHPKATAGPQNLLFIKQSLLM
jgi:hypothetical protein